MATAARPEGSEEAGAQRIPRPVRAPLWGWLPWVATAAGIAAITSILLFHPQKRLSPATTSTSNTKPTPDQRAEIPAEAMEQATVSAAPEAKARHEKQAPVSAESPRAARAQPTTDVAKSQASEQSESELALNNAGRSTALAASSQPIAGAPAAKAVSPSTTVEVAPTQNSMLPETMNTEPGTALGGPVRAGGVARAFSGVSARPQWRINEARTGREIFMGCPVVPGIGSPSSTTIWAADHSKRGSAPCWRSSMWTGIARSDTMSASKSSLKWARALPRGPQLRWLPMNAWPQR